MIMRNSYFWSRTITLIVFLCCTSITKSQELDSVPDFSYKTWTYNNLVIPYREAMIHEGYYEREPALVIYLRGGPKRGNDNSVHMSEKGIGVIANYLEKKEINAIMIVPQCPEHLTWGTPTNPMLYSLIEYYKNHHNVNPKRIYLLGGSMGGTGTWQMTAEYPNLFAAVMPVAGNPEGIDIERMSHTPVYTIMGAMDNLIPMQPSIAIITALKENNAEALIDIESKFSHVKACTDSYTEERLDWLFGHRRK